MSKRRKPQSHDPRVVPLPDDFQIGPRSKRLRPFFRVLSEVTRSGDIAAADFVRGRDLEGVERFDTGVFLRGVNILKGVHVLCEQGHWEMASGLGRQLFELVLNVEWMAAQENREAATLRFSHYGLLQSLISRLESLRDTEISGRAVNDSAVRKVRDYIESDAFSEFQVQKQSDGSYRYAKSWNGLNAWQMAKASDQSMRLRQYRMLFVRWSEEAHGAPGALVPAMFGPSGPDWTREVLRQDESTIAQLIVMVLTLFQELDYFLPSGPGLGASYVSWLARLRDVAVNDFGVTGWTEARSGAGTANQ